MSLHLFSSKKSTRVRENKNNTFQRNERLSPKPLILFFFFALFFPNLCIRLVFVLVPPPPCLRHILHRPRNLLNPFPTRQDSPMLALHHPQARRLRRDAILLSGNEGGTVRSGGRRREGGRDGGRGGGGEPGGGKVGDEFGDGEDAVEGGEEDNGRLRCNEDGLALARFVDGKTGHRKKGKGETGRKGSRVVRPLPMHQPSAQSTAVHPPHPALPSHTSVRGPRRLSRAAARLDGARRGRSRTREGGGRGSGRYRVRGRSSATRRVRRKSVRGASEKEKEERGRTKKISPAVRHFVRKKLRGASAE
jgi:hypothetical protein